MHMPRKKGSKNRVKGFKSVEAVQLAIDEMTAEKESLSADITATTEQISSLKAELKKKRSSLKSLERKITKYEETKAEMEKVRATGNNNKEDNLQVPEITQDSL